MHKLMHQASPTIAAGEDQKLDDAATKYMVLRAMGPSLGRHAVVASQRATKAIGAKRAHLEQEVRAAIAGLWSDAGVINAVKAQVAPQLTTGGHPALAARVEALLRHQGAGVDTGKIARTIVKRADRREQHPDPGLQRAADGAPERAARDHPDHERRRARRRR